MFRVRVMKMYRRVTGSRGRAFLARCHMLHGGLTHRLNSGHRIVAGVDGTDGLAKHKHFYGNVICLLSKWKKTNRLPFILSDPCAVAGSRTCISFTFEHNTVNPWNKRLCSSCNKQSFSDICMKATVTTRNTDVCFIVADTHTRWYNVVTLLLLRLVVPLADQYIWGFYVLYMISMMVFWDIYTDS